MSKLTNTLLQVFFTKVSVVVAAVSASVTLVVRRVAAVSIAVHLVVVQELSVNVLISALDIMMSFSLVPTRRFVSSTLLLTPVVCIVPTPMEAAN